MVEIFVKTVRDEYNCIKVTDMDESKENIYDGDPLDKKLGAIDKIISLMCQKINT